MFFIAQISSFIALVINVIAVQLKSKKQILLTVVACNIFFIISYILLGANIGALTCGFVAVEIIINTILEDSGKKTPLFLIIIYLLICLLIGILNFSGPMDILPILGSSLFILTLIQTKEKYVRLLILGNLIAWVIYDFFVQAYFAGISDSFVICSTVTAIFRYDIMKKSEIS